MRPLARDIFFHAYTPRPGDVVVEAGAGSGTETVELARLVGPRGLVIAIEPHPGEFAKLSASAFLGGNNVKLVNAALADEPGQAWITDGAIPERNYLDRAHSAIARALGLLPVEVVTLDRVAREQVLDRVDLLKMNIEGSEVGALLGFSEGLARTRNVVVSCHDFLGDETKADVLKILVEAGFVVSGRQHADPCVADYVYGRRS